MSSHFALKFRRPDQSWFSTRLAARAAPLRQHWPMRMEAGPASACSEQDLASQD